MAVGLDFSFARPGGAALAAAGVASVGRYLATDGRGISANEFADYVSHGVSVWLIKENAARGMLNGFAQGVSDARDAEAQMAAIGVTGAAVYCTVDFDAATSQFAALDAYLDGFTSVLGLARVGVYAGLHYLNHVVGRATFFWKTASSSFDHGEAPAMQLHLIQTLDQPPVSGTDVNVIVQQYHGQVTRAGVADLGATLIKPILEEDSMAKNFHNADGTVFTVGETWGRIWTDTTDFSYLTNMALSPLVEVNMTMDQIKTAVGEANGRGTAYAAVAAGPGGSGGLSAAAVQTAVEAAVKAIFAQASK